MPQLEQLATFPSQIFWLFACFGIIFLFLQRYAVPRLSHIIEIREGTITSDIETAKSSRDLAVQLKKDLDVKLAAARQLANAQTEVAAKQATTLYDSGIGQTEEEVKKSVEEAEKRIILEAKKAEEEVSGNINEFVQEILSKLSIASEGKALKKANGTK